MAVISSIAAPTVAQLNAGTLITNFVTKDGLTVPANQNYVDNSSLAETYDAQVVGSFGGAITLTGIRDSATDTFWDTVVYATNTHLVVRRGVPTATAWTAAQDVEVYPIQWHEPLPLQTASNEQGRFSAAAAVTSQPNLKAVVAA
ncbi:MAG: hypothetical protein ACRD0W_21530 [Acidimicrobiales bacterium]